jgi:hypothetical protein
MPLIGWPTAQLLAACVDVGYGVAVEKWYIGWLSVALNVVNVVIALAAVSLATEALVVLILYRGLWAGAARYRWRNVYVLFGN